MSGRKDGIPDELVEKAAHAIYTARGGYTFFTWAISPRSIKLPIRRQARRALEAVGLPALLERVEAAEADAEEAAEASLYWQAEAGDIERQRDALAAKVARVAADDSLIYATAKASWDRGERDYWDHESDMRPFDPSITDLDGDDCDHGKDWLETVTEIITDFRVALTEGTEGA